MKDLFFPLFNSKLKNNICKATNNLDLFKLTLNLFVCFIVCGQQGTGLTSLVSITKISVPQQRRLR